MKKADASVAKLAVFATADELAQGMVGVKALRAGANAYAEQALEPVTEAAARVAAALKA